MTETSNLKLIKPAGNEVYNIEQFNENMDKLDKASLPSYISSGTAAALTADGLEESDNMKIQLRLHTAIADGATLNGKPILTQEGEPISSGALEGSFLILIFNESADCWYQAGGGSGFYIKISGSDKKAYLELDPETGIVYVKEK